MTQQINKKSDNINRLVENLDFSDIAEQMATLKAAIFDTTDTNHSKIELIKEELATGRYQIHSKNIATKLLENIELPQEVETS
jgi:flagellar biosynthesis anti-sigma factor FlgM